MPAIEVQRQMLPMLGSPNQGARFYNPDLPQTEPFVPGHQTCAGCGPSIQHRMTSQATSRPAYGGMTTLSPPGAVVPEGKKLFPKDLARMMAAGHPHCYVATASVGYPIDLMNKVRKGLNHKGAAYLMIYTPCQKGFVYETPRSIDLGRLVVECGLYPIWEWDPEKREYDYTFRPQSMRPVSEYLKLQGRFGHLHAEHIATLQKFANAQWKMMGVELPEALLRAAEAKNLVDMASAEAATAVAQTV